MSQKFIDKFMKELKEMIDERQSLIGQVDKTDKEKKARLSKIERLSELITGHRKKCDKLFAQMEQEK